MIFVISSINNDTKEFEAYNLNDDVILECTFSFDSVKESDLKLITLGNFFKVANKALYFNSETWSEKDLEEVNKKALEYSKLWGNHAD